MPFGGSRGVFFALMLLGGITGFLLGDAAVEPTVIGRMSLSMALAIPQLVLGIVLWISFVWYHRREQAHCQPRA